MKGAINPKMKPAPSAAASTIIKSGGSTVRRTTRRFRHPGGTSGRPAAVLAGACRAFAEADHPDDEVGPHCLQADRFAERGSLADAFFDALGPFGQERIARRLGRQPKRLGERDVLFDEDAEQIGEGGQACGANQRAGDRQ